MRCEGNDVSDDELIIVALLNDLFLRSAEEADAAIIILCRNGQSMRWSTVYIE
jgi:hypothetical protein